MPRRSQAKTYPIFTISAIALLGSLFFGIQYYAALQTQREASREISELEKIDTISIPAEKTKQEAISLTLKNAQEKLVLSTFITRITAAGAGFVTAGGFLLAIFQYLDLRRKEQEQEIHKQYSELWEGLLQTEASNSRFVISLLDLYDVFQLQSPSPDQIETSLSALGVFGRVLKGKLFNISQDLRDLADYAYARSFKLCLSKFPDNFKTFSWQGIRCANLDLSASNLDLSRLDLRDTCLDGGNFSELQLKNAILTGSSLRMCNLGGANLYGANLDNTDLTDADLSYADLTNANLNNANIFNTNLAGSILKGSSIGFETIDWRLSINWRDAIFDDAIKEKLFVKYGPNNKDGVKILFLLYEYPFKVSGGGWTAAYHIIRTLRLKGANITVAVPWHNTQISQYVLGSDITLIPCGSEEKEAGGSGQSSSEEPQYTATYDFKLIADFAFALIDIIQQKQNQYDVIIAHDWLTMPAAYQLSKRLMCPWIAHFHSIGSQRQKKPVNPGILQIEKHYSGLADHIFVPGKQTKRLLAADYAINETRISVIPNPMLFEVETHDFHFKTSTVGEYHSQRVIYTGRLQWQKGIDVFISLMDAISSMRPGTDFRIFGKCEENKLDYYNNLELVESVNVCGEGGLLRGPLPDNVRIVDILAVEEGLEQDFLEYRPIDIACNWESIKNQSYTLSACDAMTSNAHSLHYWFRLEAIDTDSRKQTYLVRIQGWEHSGLASLIKFDKKKPATNIYKRFKTWETREDVFTGASVCVVPSRHEPFGMVVLESMARGVPVIYPSHSGVADKMHSGIKVNFEDHDKVYSEIIRLLDSPEYWKEIVDQQLEEIQKYAEFSKDELPNDMLRHMMKRVHKKS